MWALLCETLYFLSENERYRVFILRADGETTYKCGACVKQLGSIMNENAFVLLDLLRYLRLVRRWCLQIDNLLFLN
jgi:hypothetical protein